MSNTILKEIDQLVIGQTKTDIYTQNVSMEITDITWNGTFNTIHYVDLDTHKQNKCFLDYNSGCYHLAVGYFYNLNLTTGEEKRMVDKGIYTKIDEFDLIDIITMSVYLNEQYFNNDEPIRGKGLNDLYLATKYIYRPMMKYQYNSLDFKKKPSGGNGSAYMSQGSR